MAKYKVKDFSIGERVYHLSNRSIAMVVIEIDHEHNIITCRWIDKAGQVQNLEFIAEELGKCSDLRPTIISI